MQVVTIEVVVLDHICVFDLGVLIKKKGGVLEKRFRGVSEGVLIVEWASAHRYHLFHIASPLVLQDQN